MAGFLEAPAEIDIVAGGVKLGVEPTEFVQHVFPDREVATGNVLGLGVREKYVDWPAGRVGDTPGNRVRVQGRGVRSANRCASRSIEAVREVMQPVRIGPRVGVDIGDDLAGSRGSTNVTRGTQTRIRGPDEPHAELRRNRSGVVGRPVVDDDDLEVRVLEALDPLQRLTQRSATVVSADHHRHPWPVPFNWERHVRESGGDRGQRRFRLAVRARQTEGPIVDVLSGTEPLIRPREHERARAAGRECLADLPVECVRLHVLAVAKRIETELTHQNGPVALTNLDIFERGGPASGNVLRNENAFRKTLEKLLDLPIVGDVRGDGYFYGIELVKDKGDQGAVRRASSRSGSSAATSPAAPYENGLYCRSDDRGDPVVQVAPPLICGQAEFDEMEQKLRYVLSEASTLL